MGPLIRVVMRGVCMAKASIVCLRAGRGLITLRKFRAEGVRHVHVVGMQRVLLLKITYPTCRVRLISTYTSEHVCNPLV